ncbi:unnamed protein product, partial [Candidula unifasciata]
FYNTLFHLCTKPHLDCFLINYCLLSSGEVYEYADCKGAYQQRVGVEDGRIPDSALTASTSNAKRMPKDGRVGRSAGAWSPSIQNSFQWLQVDMGKQYIVTQLLTQGRQGSDEYVREYFLEYSDDSKTWRRYTNMLGVSEVFEGNADDASLQTRTLIYPIVARYLRFNPQRWNMVISLRIEVVGCAFANMAAGFLTGTADMLVKQILQGPLALELTQGSLKIERLVEECADQILFLHLLLVNKSLYLGGVPYFNMDGIGVKYNFIGCIQNLNLNGARMIRDALSNKLATVSIKNNVNAFCNVVAKIPVTFPTLTSKLFISAQSGRVVHVAFDFRTYDKDSLMVYHKMDSDTASVVVRIDENGFVKYTIIDIDGQTVEDVVRNVDVLSKTGSYTDGLWHTFYLYVDNEKINCTVDRNSKVSLRKLSVAALTDFYIGGYELFNGFRGCMRDIQIAQRAVDLERLSSVSSTTVVGAQIGSCGIRDRCTPNPCEHGGTCEQSWSTFNCICAMGYQGELCHSSSYYISCEMLKYYSSIEGREDGIIDPDGSGPFQPFQASCERDNSGEIITYIGHDSMGDIRVNGYQDPGSYVRKITYKAADVYELEEVIDRARTCRQNVLYKCRNARFLSDPAIKSWGWWVGRTFQPMHYWGGAAPGSGKCKCGLDEQGCGSQSTTCYCDIANPQSGYLLHKEYLPVLEMHLGDTGSTTDDNWSEYNIGELECFGDNLFGNTVTFTQKDGALEFPTFEADNAGDIWYQFKTTTTDGVMIHCVGSVVSDFIEIRLFQSDTIQFRYDVGNGVTMVTFKSPSPLSDDVWHTVHSLKTVYVSFVGSLVGFGDGYVGCMRGLRVNGRLMDMSGKLRNAELYGVREGCVGKCASSPCFNGGTCREGYDRYTCDCAYTPWRGWNCGREVGVNLKNNYMVKYTFDETQGLSASDFQRATIGFSTKVKQGILMQMRNEENTEYITVEMNNNGGVKVAMDVGFERVEVNTPMNQGIDYANSQTHVVVVERFDYGKRLVVRVDNYEPGTGTFGDASKASDTILDNPKYLFIGNNDTSNANRGFEGCIFRMQVDNIFPLKRAFQDPRPPYLELIPVREDMCGFEEITVSPEPIRSRPFTGVLQNVTYRRVTDPPLSDEEKALVGVGCALFIILVVCIILFCCKDRLEGADYETEEAKGAEYADNPDSAVVYNQTGLPNMPKSYEYFM